MKPVDPHHLAFFSASFRGGGAERMMLNLSSEMARRGHRVDLLVAENTGAYANMVSPKVRLIDLKAQRVLTALPGLVRYLCQERPEAMLATMAHVNVVAALAKLLSRSRCRLIVREAKVPTFGAAESGSIKTSMMPALRRVMYPLTDGVVAISHDVKKFLIETSGLSPSLIHVIHNPAYFPEIDRQAGAAVDHPWLQSDASLPVIVGMGRLVNCKDFDTLIEAFAILHKQRPSRLIIFGEGPLRASLSARAARLGIADAVDLPGFVDNPFAHLRRARVFVCSSTHEAFGNVIVEALATGTPVVSTNCPGGPPEILANGQWGRLVPVGDASAMAQAIAQTFDDDPDPARHLERARHFHVERIAEEYLAQMCPSTGRRP